MSVQRKWHQSFGNVTVFFEVVHMLKSCSPLFNIFLFFFSLSLQIRLQAGGLDFPPYQEYKTLRLGQKSNAPTSLHLSADLYFFIQYLITG